MAGYSTSFPTNEAPLSYGGTFLHTPNPWATVSANGGEAFGTQSGSGGFDDAYVYLAMPFSQNYIVKTTAIKGTVGAGFHEIENLGHWSDTSTTISGYETNIAFDGQYIAIYKLVGTQGTFFQMAQVNGTRVPVTGDVLSSTYVRNTIQSYLNNELLINAIDDGTHLGAALTNGAPGFGFFRDAASSDQKDFGITQFSAEDLFVTLVGVRTENSTAALNATTFNATSRAVVKGDLVIIGAFQSVANKQTLSISDSVNTYHQIGTNIDVGGGDDSSVTLWYAVATTTTTLTPQLVFGATNTGPVAIWFDLALGIDSNNPLSSTAAQSQTGIGTTPNAVTSGNASPVGSRVGFLVYALSMNISGSIAPVFGSGFLDAGTGWAFGGTPLARAETEIVKTDTAVAGTFTGASGTNDFITFVAIFNGAETNNVFFGAGTTS
ncbi:MAG TPA: hypothetical protein VK571_06000 [Gemmatimonadaceae bacterium]|nr:hypothetical protein [Gemmatimonadaceae bacterium]